MTQELRRLAEAANTTYEERAAMPWQDFVTAYQARKDFEAAANPSAILSLLDRLESLQDIQALQAVSDEYNAWIRYHAAGGDYDDFLKGVLAKQQAEDDEDDAGADCTPNHNCNGRMVHLPDGEHCDHCGSAMEASK